MQIPMEILSQMMTRTDSGTGVRQRAGPSDQGGSKFGKILDKTLAESQSQSLIPDKPDSAAAYKDAAPVKPQKPDDNSTPIQAYAAGVMGNHKDVVFILEGDMESATGPDMRIEAAAGTYRKENPEDLIPAGNEEKPETDTRAGTAEVKSRENAEDTGKTHSAASQTDKAGAANAEAIKQAIANAEAANGAQGEVTARTPNIRTSDRQGNEESSSGFSGHGDLSPLENENDASQVKGQKGKTFSDTVAAVRNAAEGVQETVNNAPAPLAEGIRPEQFRADQQMKQATLSAPVKTENLFDEMVSRLESMQTESQRVMTIQLKPEFLGKVALEIAMDAAGLHVKISAADSGVRAMINGQLNALIESLENKGLEVVEVEVAYTGVDNGAFKENREGHEQQNKQRRSLREIDQADGVTYYTALPLDTLEYYLEAGVSSVEYRA